MRDAEKWYTSTYETIYQGFALPDWLLNVLPAFRGMKKMENATTWDGLFHGKFEDREFPIRIFEEHIQEVQRVVPPDRLLVFQVQDGWKPLHPTQIGPWQNGGRLSRKKGRASDNH